MKSSVRVINGKSKLILPCRLRQQLESNNNDDVKKREKSPHTNHFRLRFYDFSSDDTSKQQRRKSRSCVFDWKWNVVPLLVFTPTTARGEVFFANKKTLTIAFVVILIVVVFLCEKFFIASCGNQWTCCRARQGEGDKSLGRRNEKLAIETEWYERPKSPPDPFLL